jgi:hypothetical protein
MNNEPVACTGQNTFCKYCHRIPSQCNCTHPAKTLTDEEIGEIYKEFFGFKPKDKYAVDFARAILKKASEK